MQQSKNRPLCHRAEDLVTYLYAEATEAEAIEFRQHLAECDACRGELQSFNQVHDSILVWRNEALGAWSQTSAVTQTVSAPFAVNDRKLSALAAIRQFFDVSPLWLRGATAFAGLLLCTLLVFAVSRFWQRPVETTKNLGEPKIFTQADLDKAVADAKQQNKADEALPESAPEPDKLIVAGPPQAPRNPTQSKSSPRIKALTPQEREQLAADLRLIPQGDDEDTTLTLPDEEHPN